MYRPPASAEHFKITLSLLPPWFSTELRLPFVLEEHPMSIFALAPPPILTPDPSFALAVPKKITLSRTPSTDLTNFRPDPVALETPTSFSAVSAFVVFTHAYLSSSIGHSITP
jgi:hypothetical protein